MSSTLSPELSALQTKIDAGTAHIGIYGLGYVGLPLALRFAEVGLKVTGFDIDSAKVQQVTIMSMLEEGLKAEQAFVGNKTGDAKAALGGAAGAAA